MNNKRKVINLYTVLIEARAMKANDLVVSHRAWKPTALYKNANHHFIRVTNTHFMTNCDTALFVSIKMLLF